MNYGELPAKILTKVMTLVSLVNNIEVEPEVRRRYMEQLFHAVDTKIYTKIYEMNAWDMLIPHTSGKGISNSYYGLSKVAAAQPATAAELSALVLNNMQQNSSKAQYDAFETARDSGKVPTVERRTTNIKACKWCVSKVGVYPDPEPDIFARHADCTCEIWTTGYNSRNGLLQNYKKSRKS